MKTKARTRLLFAVYSAASMASLLYTVGAPWEAS
jgi:hypothetical protein